MLFVIEIKNFVNVLTAVITKFVSFKLIKRTKSQLRSHLKLLLAFLYGLTQLWLPHLLLHTIEVVRYQSHAQTPPSYVENGSTLVSHACQTLSVFQHQLLSVIGTAEQKESGLRD